VTGVKDYLRERIPQQAIDRLKYSLLPRALQASGEERASLFALVRLSFDEINQLAKVMLDQRPGDIGRFSDLMLGWSTLSENLVRTGSDPDELIALSRRREVLQFGLATWVFRQLRRRPTPERADQFRVLASYFTPADAAVVTERFLDDEFNDRGPWTTWVLEELGEGVHSIGLDEDALSTFVGICVVQGAQSEFPRLPALDLFRARHDQLARCFETLKTDERLSELLGLAGEWDRRLEALARALDDARGQAEREQAIRVSETGLDPEREEAFISDVRRGWAESRLLPSVFRHFDQYIDEAFGSERTGWFGLDHWVPKAMLIPGSGYVLVDNFAHDAGRAVARGHIDALLQRITADPKPASVPLKGQLTELLTTDFSPRSTAVFLPISWKLDEHLGLRRAWDGDRASEATWLPEGVRQWFSGEISGAIVISWPGVPSDRIAVVDFSRFATWRQEPIAADGELLRVTLQAYDAEQAGQLLLDQHGVVEESEVLKIIESLLLRTRERFMIQVRDPRGAAFLEVPEDLRFQR
jgi:hypothetical protein